MFCFFFYEYNEFSDNNNQKKATTDYLHHTNTESFLKLFLFLFIKPTIIITNAANLTNVDFILPNDKLKNDELYW